MRGEWEGEAYEEMGMRGGRGDGAGQEEGVEGRGLSAREGGERGTYLSLI